MVDETLVKRMYKLNTNGSTQVWEIHSNDSQYWSESGRLGGAMIVSAPTDVVAKQKRTLAEQVEFICQSKINKQIDKKYVEDVADIHTADEKLLGFTVMLAHEYEKQKRKIVFPCIGQPKLDGIRCPTTADGMFSRGRKRFNSCLHIQAELDDFYEGDATAELDGELYTHEFKSDFESICGAVKKSADTADANELALQAKMQYHVYDTPRIGDLVETDAFVTRQAALAEAFANSTSIKVVETVIVNNEEELIALKKRFESEGYEGIMVRNIDSVYGRKRSYDLLKWKEFIDEEFLIIGINEGTGRLKGCAGSFKFALYNNEGDMFIAGLSGEPLWFKAKLKGSTERLKYLFEHPEECVGKMATIRYQNRTKYNVPRFPVCQAIRDYE
jgi:ATP-dependent DNA ligase